MKIIKITVALILVLFFLSQTNASQQSPMEVVKKSTETIIALLTDESLDVPEKAAELREKISAVAKDLFDWEYLARAALSVHWKKRTTKEKTEFIELYRQYIESIYFDKIETYSGERISFDKEAIDKQYPDEATVYVSFYPKNAAIIKMEFLLFDVDGVWKVYDVIAEGISLTANISPQFNSIINEKSYEELLKILKEKVDFFVSQ